MSPIKATSQLLRDTYQRWRTDGAPQIAAAMTYYAFLSLAPMLVVLVAVLGRWLGQAAVAEQIFAQANALGGPMGEQLARNLIASAGPSTMSVAAPTIALLIAFSGAMQLFRQLRIAFDRMWDIPPEEAPEGGLWVQIKWSLSALGKTNLAAFMIVLAVGGLLVVSLLLSSIVGVAAHWIAPLLGIDTPSLGLFETLLSVALVTLLFAIIYRYLPRTSIAWRDVWVGATMTSALFLLGRVLLGVYFTYASPGSLYGAAGSVVALLIWVNVSMQLVLYGAEFTHVWTYTHGSRAPKGIA